MDSINHLENLLKEINESIEEIAELVYDDNMCAYRFYTECNGKLIYEHYDSAMLIKNLYEEIYQEDLYIHSHYDDICYSKYGFLKEFNEKLLNHEFTEASLSEYLEKHLENNSLKQIITGDIRNKYYSLHCISLSILDLIVFTDAIECITYKNDFNNLDMRLIAMSQSNEIFKREIHDNLSERNKRILFRYSIIYRNEEIFNALLHEVELTSLFIDTAIEHYNFDFLKEIINTVDEIDYEFYINEFYADVPYQELLSYLIDSHKVKIDDYSSMLPYLDMKHFHEIVSTWKDIKSYEKEIIRVFNEISDNVSFKRDERYRITDKLFILSSALNIHVSVE